MVSSYIAGMESRAKRRSVLPSATMTRNIGVIGRLDPSLRDLVSAPAASRSALPWMLMGSATSRRTTCSRDTRL
jgi:hypothetical protein